MLLPALLPLSAGGLQPPFVNVGIIENKGWEFTLNTVNTIGEFNWKTAANFSANQNLIVDLGSSGVLTGVVQRIPVTRTEEGQPIGMFYGYQVEGIFQSYSEWRMLGKSLPNRWDGSW